MDITWLEEQLRQHPLSPLFARLASEYSAAGRNAEAIDLCRNGIIHLPAYATGHLVLAKCYARESNFALALASLAEAKAYAGDFPAYQALFDEWSSRATEQPGAQPGIVTPPESHELTHPSEPEAEPFTSPESHDVVEPSSPEAEPFTPPESHDIVEWSKPEAEPFSPPESHDVVEQSKPEAEPFSPPESHDVVGWSKPEVEQFAPPPPQEPTPPPRVAGIEPTLSSEELEQIRRTTPSDDDEGRIISKTLAEIFAAQGEFDEAIVTYRLLLQMRPEQSDEISQRIDELCRLREEKQAQQSPTPPPPEA